jgi:hypothetical protein
MEHSLSAQQLIERAFAQARRSGKPEWWVMAIPVLKNRLLQITGQKFKEADFGASSFRDFLQQRTDVLLIDDSFTPGAVTLKSASNLTTASSSATQPRDRIRPDLWRAVLDYSSGNTYVWDATNSTAIIGPETDDAPSLPTLSAESFKEWKGEFLATLPAQESDGGRVKEWQEQSLPTVVLPSVVRFSWNRFVKQKVQTTLTEWFEKHHIPAPPLTQLQAAPTESSRDETERIREFVIECVTKMSKEELERLSIPSGAAFRVRSNH